MCDFKALNKNSFYYHKKTRHGKKKEPVKHETVIPNDVPVIERDPDLKIDVPVIERDPDLKIRLCKPTDYSPSRIPIHFFDKDHIDRYSTIAQEQNMEIVVEVRYTFTPL